MVDLWEIRQTIWIFAPNISVMQFTISDIEDILSIFDFDRNFAI